MSEYKITKISEQEPKKYDGQYGTVYYHKVMLEGHDRPVSIGKKTADKPTIGETIYGTIQPKPDYDVDGFKSEKKPFTPNGSKSYGKSLEERHNIMKMNALNNAVAHIGSSIDNLPDPEKVIMTAEEFYRWLMSGENNTEEKKASESEF